MISKWYFIISKVKKDEENRDLRRNMVHDHDGRLTLRDVVPIVEMKEDNDEDRDC
tara:strand:+ start:28 stop:192 length:165 start_codon:yes stop_codon:yes gene_type:complete